MQDYPFSWCLSQIVTRVTNYFFLLVILQQFWYLRRLNFQQLISLVSCMNIYSVNPFNTLAFIWNKENAASAFKWKREKEIPSSARAEEKMRDWRLLSPHPLCIHYPSEIKHTLWIILRLISWWSYWPGLFIIVGMSLPFSAFQSDLSRNVPEEDSFLFFSMVSHFNTFVIYIFQGLHLFFARTTPRSQSRVSATGWPRFLFDTRYLFITSSRYLNIFTTKIYNDGNREEFCPKT